MKDRALRAMGMAAGLALTLATPAIAAGPPGANPDNRAYEMVSPPDKGGFPLDVKATVQASSDGGAVAFPATGAFAGAESSMLSTYYVARRSAAGWSVKPVTPPLRNARSSLSGLTRFFSESLDSAMQLSTSGLAPGAAEGGSNLYRLNTTTGSRSLLATSPLPNLVVSEAPISFTTPENAAATADLSQYVFSSPVGLLPGLPNRKLAYQVIGDQLHHVSLLPGEVMPATTASIAAVTGRRSPDAVSRDGRRVIFNSPAASGQAGQAGLYMRVDGSMTIPISVSQVPGDPPTVQAAGFAGASDDGTIVYFMSNSILTTGAAADAAVLGGGVRRLYRYDAGTGILTHTSPIADPAGGIHNGGVSFYVSPDGGSIYFSSNASLVPGVPIGVPKVYRYTHGQGTVFVGAINTLNTDDVQVSDNGRFLMAVGRAALPGGFDNTDPDCQPELGLSGTTPGTCLEVYVYDAVEDHSQCVTCVNAEGGNAHSRIFGMGAAGQSRNVSGHLPRAVIDDGTIFFTSREALVPEDVNGRDDVYRWRDGVTSLISTGRDHRHSGLAETSSDGENVFFYTFERLVASDVDDEADLYVARVDGGIAAQHAVAVDDRSCESDSCQGPLDSAPIGALIGSLGLSGPGDVASGPGARSVRASLIRGSVRGASFAVRVRVPGPGLLIASGARVRRSSRAVGRAAIYEVRVALDRSARRALARRHRLRVRTRLVYVGATGRRVGSSVSVTLKANGKRTGNR